MVDPRDELKSKLDEGFMGVWDSGDGKSYSDSPKVTLSSCRYMGASSKICGPKSMSEMFSKYTLLSSENGSQGLP